MLGGMLRFFPPDQQCICLHLEYLGTKFKVIGALLYVQPKFQNFTIIRMPDMILTF